jgi:hypothetical protein
LGLTERDREAGIDLFIRAAWSSLTSGVLGRGFDDDAV